MRTARQITTIHDKTKKVKRMLKKLNISPGAAVGALVVFLMMWGAIGWIGAVFMHWGPRLSKQGPPDQEVFWSYMSNPSMVFQEAWQQESFTEFLAVACVVALILAYFFYRFFAKDTVYKEASSYGAYGTSRFANSREIFNDKTFAKRTKNTSGPKNMNNPAGLIFGLYRNKPVILPEMTKIPNRNVFIVGSPGSGKTQSYILTNIIHERERSIVVTDPKGEIYEATAELKRQQGYEVRLVNFKEMTISDRYNPLDYIHKEIDAEQIATTIVLNSQTDIKPDFWTRAEIALLKTLLLYVKYEYPEEATMAKVKEILTVQGANPKRMDSTFRKLKEDHPAYQAYLVVKMAEERVRASIFISLGVTLSKFDPTDVRKFTETSDFKLDDIGKRKMIVYCILPVADATWEPLISTFFSQMFQRLYDVADKNFNRLPVKVNLLLDEFPNLGTIPGYEEILATCRSYGISASTIIQSIGQLIDKYSQDKAEAIVGNCSLRFLLGVGDKLTAEYFSQLIGQTTVRTSSTSSSIQLGDPGSVSKSYSARNLLTPDELTRLPREEAILLVAGMHGIRLRKAFQYEFFKGVLNESNLTSRFDYLALREFQSHQTTSI
jgi:type IV secretion system protein VirD4